MKNLCTACGAPSKSTSICASWTCEFCSTVNFMERYVESYLASIDHAKLTSFMKLAKTAYLSRNYTDAIIKFETALAENAENVEAWAYKGLSLAHTINLANIDTIPHQVSICFENAFIQEGNQKEFCRAAHAIARERVVSELIRSAEREIHQAEKSAFAFSHDKNLARSKAGARYSNALLALLHCLSTPSDNVKQMLQVCQHITDISNEKFGPSTVPTTAVKDYLKIIAERYPDLELKLEMPMAVEKQAACFPGHALVAVSINTWVPVHQLELGDRIKVMNEKTGAWEDVYVRKINKHELVSIIAIHLAGGKVIESTQSHSFWTKRGWVQGKNLQSTDRCLEIAPGQKPEWKIVNWVHTTSRKEAVYSFQTSSHHTPCVEGILVHEMTHFRGIRSFWALILEKIYYKGSSDRPHFLKPLLSKLRINQT